MISLGRAPELFLTAGRILRGEESLSFRHPAATPLLNCFRDLELFPFLLLSIGAGLSFLAHPLFDWA